MRAAVEWCSREYVGLPRILKIQSLPLEWIFEVMAKWDVSRRTAIEYLMTASVKIKLREKEDKRIEQEIIEKEADEIISEVCGNQDKELSACQDDTIISPELR